MVEYRDIGSLNGRPNINIEVDTSRRGQVYQATHIGEQSLPYMNRSFISFTYGGKKIEDFDLIATLNDRLDRDGYASFDDITSEYENLDGQYYWNSHYKTNSISFTLSTDGIDLKKLDSFLHWFRAGISRELILAEHPNRAIMARVSSPPHLNLMPFSLDVTVKISNNTYLTKTTLFKGDISLDLVMDEPHWYAIMNVLGKKTNVGDRERFVDDWTDANNNTISIFASQDALKILYEDGIPLGSMIDNNMLLGNGAYANVENQLEARIWDPSPNNPLGLARIHGTVTGSENPVSSYAAGDYQGVIAGAIVDANHEGISSLGKKQNNNGPFGYFFYSGTAPAPTIISFDITPAFTNNYISVPRNSRLSSAPYFNTLTIESITKLELCFTTPNLFTSYNLAIYIFTVIISKLGMDWETLREEVRDNVRHAAVRAWAIKCINDNSNTNITNSNIPSTLRSAMREFFPTTMPDVTFTFNSKTGEAIGIFLYKTTPTASNFSTVTEDVGDMLKSNYIIIADRNYVTADGKVVHWTNDHPEYSHRIYHDVTNGLKKILILYKNMYL